MKVELHDKFDPFWGGYPPQMSPNDLAMWVNFRPLIAKDFKYFYYSVHVGDPILEAPGIEKDMRKVIEYASRRRIDVVGEKENEWWLIELRDHASLGVVGSILSYKTLWEEEPPDNRPVIPIVVSDYTDKNLLKVCEKLGIKFYLV